MTATLHHLAPGITYEPVPRAFATVRPACPRCPWRGRELLAGTTGWRAWIAHDTARHHCTAPDDQETAS